MIAFVSWSVASFSLELQDESFRSNKKSVVT
jgi:hypothetical protein